MPCPNCGSYQRLGPCLCTWDEIEQAVKIKRRQQREFRRKIGRPTVIERDQQKEPAAGGIPDRQ